jgi:hypothetical protein
MAQETLTVMTADARFLGNCAAACAINKIFRVFAKCYINRLREDKMDIIA